MGVVINMRNIEPWKKVGCVMDVSGIGVSEGNGKRWVVIRDA